MYENISIKNYRGINEIELNDFKKVNLLVGNNNSCKTTILEALFLLSGPTNPQLPLSLNGFRGIKALDTEAWELNFHNLNIEKPIVLSGKLKEPNEERELSIKPRTEKNIQKNNLNILKEIEDLTFSTEEKTLEGLDFEYKYKEKHNPSKIFNSHISLSQNNIEINTDNRYKEKINATISTSKNINTGIGRRFNKIQRNKEKEKIIKILKKIDSKIEDLSLGTNDTIYCDIGLKKLIPLNVMGDGVLKIFSIILAMLDVKNGIVLIDEIENGFHYSALKVLWKAIFETAKEFNVQVFSTTHSMECIKALSDISKENEEEDVKLYRLEKNEEKFRVLDYDYEILEASLEDHWEVR